MHNQHMTKWCGTHWNDADTGFSIFSLQYGALRDVFADKACNYSYREFWF